MSTGIEQSIVLAFVAAHTPLVSAEIAEKYLKDLQTSELTITDLERDASNDCIATIVNKGRKWRAKEQMWKGSFLHNIVPTDRIYTKSLEDFLNEPGTNQVYIDSNTNALYLFYTGSSAMTADDALTLLSGATGYDFTDIGTIPDLHVTEFTPKSELNLPPSVLDGRVEGTWGIGGAILNGATYFVNVAFYEFADTELGTLPAEPVTAASLLTEDGGHFLTEDGDRILLE